MFAKFEAYIKEQVSICDSEVALIRSKAIERKLQRKEFLLQQGEVCRYKIFVVKGLLRTYATREEGSEHIMRFSPENSWTTEPESLNSGIPSTLNIDALEPTEVILWTKEALHHLTTNIPAFKAFFDKMIMGSGTVLRQRILTDISLTVEEKYEEFIKNNPGIYERVPLHMIASYLGVNRKTLTRIRHAQVKAR